MRHSDLRLLVSTGVLAFVGAAVLQGQVVNGSFEAGPPGVAPPGWTVTGGGAATVAMADDLFPSDGSQYLVLTNAGVGAGPVGWGPHAPGTCGQITQVVARPPGASCGLEVDWEFLTTEPLPSPFSNAYLSIDVVNDLTGVLIKNVAFIDTGVLAGAPAYTNVPGAGAGVLTWVPNQSTLLPASGNQAPAGFKRAWVDLSTVAAGTPMRIEISVGDGGFGALGGGFPGTSYAYIDGVRLSGAQRNSYYSRLRVLGSSHLDGVVTNSDWGGDYVAQTPYRFRAAPGQLLSIRAGGYPALPLIVAAGALSNPGAVVAGLGQVNVDLALPFTTPIDGFSPDPMTAYLGTLGTDEVNFYEFMIPLLAPIGTSLTLQSVLMTPSGALSLSAATTIEVGPPQIPIAGTVLATPGGFVVKPFTVFGVWPFYGAPMPAVFVGARGNVTFGAGDADSTETETEMLTGPARIAANWNWPTGVVTFTETPSTYTISWTQMQILNGWYPLGGNLTIQMYQGTGPTPPGVFTIYYGSSTLGDGLAGISPGGLPAPAPGVVPSSDLSTTAYSLGARGTVPGGTALFERFSFSDIPGLLRDHFDLMTIGGGVSRITFVPHYYPGGLLGYTVFTGTR